MRRRLVAVITSLATLVALVVGASAAVTATATGAEAATEAARSGSVGVSPGYAILWMSDADLDRELDTLAATGVGWIRVDFDWPSAEPRQGTFNWDPIDRVVAEASARGIEVLAVPAYTPSWARPSGTSDKHPPTNFSHFASFVRQAASRYTSRGVDHWEIWNEPNIRNFWAPLPNPEAYTRLLEQASTAIRNVNPSATILSGGVAPAADTADGSGVHPLTFVRRMYAAGGRNSFDAIASHPYSYPALATGTESWNPFYRLPEMRQIMVANGDSAKKIWITEYGAPTGTGENAVSETRQARTITDAFAQLANWSWDGPLFVYSYRDVGTNPADREDNFGMVRRDFSPKPAWTAFRDAIAAAAPPPRPPTTTTTAPPPTTTAPPPTTTAPPNTHDAVLLPARLAVKVFGTVFYYVPGT